MRQQQWRTTQFKAFHLSWGNGGAGAVDGGRWQVGLGRSGKPDRENERWREAEMRGWRISLVGNLVNGRGGAVA